MFNRDVWTDREKERVKQLSDVQLLTLALWLERMATELRRLVRLHRASQRKRRPPHFLN